MLSTHRPAFPTETVHRWPAVLAWKVAEVLLPSPWPSRGTLVYPICPAPGPHGPAGTGLHVLMQFHWELKAMGGEWGSPHTEVSELFWTPFVSQGLKGLSFKPVLV